MKSKSKAAIKVTAVILSVAVLVAAILYAVPNIENKVCRNSNNPEKFGNLSSWMSSVDGNLKLNEINIPGTHDSATQYVQLALFSKCQCLNIKEQLDAGFRYLDIRLAVDNEKLKLVHGFTSCKTDDYPWNENLCIDTVLSQCYDFLKENPSETVLFVVKQENKDDDTKKFQNIIENCIKDNPEMWFLDNEIPTLYEARGKIVLFRRYEDEAQLQDKSGIKLKWEDQRGSEIKDLPYEKYELKVGDGSLFVQDRFEYGLADKQNAFEKSLEDAETVANKNDVFINFASTKGSLPVGHPYFFAKKMNERFLQSELEDKYFGWLIFDYATSAVASKVIETNF